VCADVHEQGSDVHQGGQRDEFNPWDFYTVPVPARPDPNANGVVNATVNFQDVLAVLAYVGTHAGDGGSPNLNGMSYDSLKDGDWFGAGVMHPNGLTDAEDRVGRRYDRSPLGRVSGPPDGAVNFQDVLAVLAQVGDSCLIAP
jgi:hypothetical protein